MNFSRDIKYGLAMDEIKKRLELESADVRETYKIMDTILFDFKDTVTIEGNEYSVCSEKGLARI